MIVENPLTNGSCPSLINCIIQDIQPLINDYPMYKCENVAWGAFKVAGVFALSAVTFTIPFLQTIAFGAVVGSYRNYQYNSRAELVIKMAEILQRSLAIISTNIQNPERGNLENDYINSAIGGLYVENWTRENFQFNLNKFGEFSEFSKREFKYLPTEGLCTTLKLIFLIAISNIQGGKRSAFATCVAFEGTITEAGTGQVSSNGRELILLSRYHLGKCYAEIGEIEKARNQYNIILGGTQNVDLRNIVSLART